MVDVEGGYRKISSCGMDSDQKSSNWRQFKTGTALLGGSCLVVFLIMATCSTLSLPALHSTIAAESTSLFSSMRAPTPVVNVPTRAAPSMGQFPRNMNSMDNQGKFLSQGLRPLFQNSPDQSRSVLARNFFQDLFKNAGRDENLYQKNEWKTGDKADYYSSQRRVWLNCEITDANDRGEVQVSVKPGVWISKGTQKTNLRQRFGIKGYATNKGKDLSLPNRRSQAMRDLMEKQKGIEEDSVKKGIWR